MKLVRRSRYLVFLALGVVGVIGLFTVVSLVSSSTNTNLQKVLQNIPNDSILGISRLIYSEKQDEILKKLELINKELVSKQDERIQKLEQMNEGLMAQLKLIKNQQTNTDMSIRDKLIFLQPYEYGQKFPAYIWQTWKHGVNDEQFGEEYREGERQWMYKNLGFVHEIFNDDTSYTMVKYLYSSIPEVIRTYEILPEVALKMDFFRYLLLYAKGGVYADIDTYPLQPVPNWIPQNVSPLELGLVIGVESENNQNNWREMNAHRIHLGNFIIQAKPGHPALREIIAQIIEKTQNMRKEGEMFNDLNLGGIAQKSLKLLKWTGSGMWTDIIIGYFNNYVQSSVIQKISWREFYNLEVPKLVSDVLVLPRKSFASDLDPNGKMEDSLAFVKHSAAKLWSSS